MGGAATTRALSPPPTVTACDSGIYDNV